jgi:hypothetical protein
LEDRVTLFLIFLALIALGVYWFFTQIMPERQRVSLIRPGLGAGILGTLNERRYKKGLPILELDDELCAVAENKAVHQILTGLDDEGWDYPRGYDELFGQSLFMELLFCGPLDQMAERVVRQRDLYEGEWVRCGIGVAGGRSDHVSVAVILGREAWEPLVDASAHRRRSFSDWLALGK